MPAKRIGLALLLLAAVLVLAAAPALARGKPVTAKSAAWTLSKARIVDPGEVLTLPEGSFLQGFVVEALARGAKDAPHGTFQLTLSAFSPVRDMPGQKAGQWYVQGVWSIVRKGATPEMLKADPKKNLVAEGMIQTELSFNPVGVPAKWSAEARAPMAWLAGQWARGQGSLSLDETFAGALYLDLTVLTAAP